MASSPSSLLEVKDILAITHGMKTLFPGSLCVLKNTFQEYIIEQFHDLSEIKEVLNTISSEKLKTVTNNAADTFSKYPTLSALCNSPYMNSFPSNNMYSTFSFESMHDLFLKISRMVKYCTLDFLHDPLQLTTSYKEIIQTSFLISARKCSFFLINFVPWT